MFSEAKPIWIEERAREYNVLCGFLLKFHCAAGSEYRLHVAAADTYQCYLNGEFFAAGPARAAKNYYRVDEFNLDGQLQKGENTLAFLVAGYNVNCFEYACSDPFLMCEVFCGDTSVVSTSENTCAFYVSEHVQRVPRYAFQRAFTEVWRLDGAYSGMLSGESVRSVNRVKVLRDRKLLSRSSPYPDYGKVPGEILASGTMIGGQDYGGQCLLTGPAFLEPTKVFQTFPLNKTDCNLYEETAGLKTVSFDYAINRRKIEASRFRLYDFAADICGYIRLEVEAEEDAELYVLFDEILTRGDVDPFRLSCINCVKYEFKRGSYRCVTLEPYCFRYAKLYVAKGCLQVKEFSVVECANSRVQGVRLHCSNEKLNQVFAAALNSFRFNAVDILMDCPSRERAGWLCDGYFTGHVERVLTGGNGTEHDFLQNFLLHNSFDNVPSGMLPMCYPAEHRDGVFIPTWAMWYVLELERYSGESGDDSLVKQAKKRVNQLLQYFSGYENGEELLEDLPGWVFIEWSKAAEFTDGVNFPVNMLYSKMLDSAGRLYRDKKLTEKAARVREKVRSLAVQGRFYVDHAVRAGGVLTPRSDVTEVCQYYAFFTDTATPERDAELWNTLLTEFGPKRKQNNRYGHVHFANAFIGNYLRLLTLERYGKLPQLLSEAQDYFTYMADKTGTLWENDTDTASCNHGFASYAACWLITAVAGYRGLDEAGKPVVTPELDFLDYCDAVLPAGGGKGVHIRWKRENGELKIDSEVFSERNKEECL